MFCNRLKYSFCFWKVWIMERFRCCRSSPARRRSCHITHWASWTRKHARCKASFRILRSFIKPTGAPADKHLQLFFVWLRSKWSAWTAAGLSSSLTAGKTPRTRHKMNLEGYRRERLQGLRSAIRVAGGQLVVSAAKIWVGIGVWVKVFRDA